MLEPLMEYFEFSRVDEWTSEATIWAFGGIGAG